MGESIFTLKKINDFPLYISTFYGNYKLDEYMNGAITHQNDIVPFFESMFNDLGYPVKLNYPQKQNGQIGCSAFYYREKNNICLVGKNLDWKKDPVLLLKTKPANGYSSLSLVNLDFCDFFNLNSMDHKILLAPYVPLDGMNEEGLIVSMLSVNSGSEYPYSPDKQSVGDFNIIRIILDKCKNVKEAVAMFNKYNLVQTSILPLHYLIADQNESCIIEFFNGEVHIKNNDNVNYLTNFLIQDKIEFAKQSRYCDRYQLLDRELRNRQMALNLQESKLMLDKLSVFQRNLDVPTTLWSIVFNPNILEMHIKICNRPKYYSVKVKSIK